MDCLVTGIVTLAPRNSDSDMHYFVIGSLTWHYKLYHSTGISNLWKNVSVL